MSEKPKRILTGIQSTGIPHLGNILGAIIPAINFSKKANVETYLFIADFHSLTQIKDSKALKQNTLFTHNSINGKTWHRYSSSTQRITLNVFFVDPNLILPGRIDTKFLI